MSLQLTCARWGRTESITHIQLNKDRLIIVRPKKLVNMVIILILIFIFITILTIIIMNMIMIVNTVISKKSGSQEPAAQVPRITAVERL